MAGGGGVVWWGGGGGGSAGPGPEALENSFALLSFLTAERFFSC